MRSGKSGNTLSEEMVCAWADALAKRSPAGKGNRFVVLG